MHLSFIIALNTFNMEQANLLEELELTLEQASHGKRFLNFVIDTIAFYGVIFLLVIPIIFLFPESFEDEAALNSSIEGLMGNIIFIIFYLMYYSLFEYLAGGRTLGKLITGTMAIMDDGSKMSFGTCLKRNAIRLIPFEIFSYFGSPCYPWHDKWTNTYVIDVKKSNL
jgi:uncharacterized RDD family membrane protein YckC